MAIRATGTATITFGMVAIPVKIFTSSETADDIKFSFVTATGEKLSQQLVDSEGTVYTQAQASKGYKVGDDYVVFDPAEIKAVESESTKKLEIKEFVPASEVKRAQVEKVYYLAVQKGGERAYTLLEKVLANTDRVAIAKYAVRGKDYIVAIRADDGYVIMEQLKFANVFRPVSAIPLNAEETTDAEVEMATELVESMTNETFDLAACRNDAQDRLAKLVEQKINNPDAVATVEGEQAKSKGDALAEALKASIAAAK